MECNVNDSQFVEHFLYEKVLKGTVKLTINRSKIFIIGAQKSGTTSLASLLGHNPMVCVSEPKEPNYYSINYEKGAEWYKNCFQRSDKVLVDASTTYTMCPLTKDSLNLKDGRDKLLDVPHRIYSDNPNARIIYIIRHPVGRMYSNYWHNMKYGYENKPFEQAIKDDPLYVEMSFYYLQLEKYLDFFKKEQILVLKFEDLVKNQLTILNECERFISVNETEVNIENKDENKGKQYGSLAKRLMNNSFVQSIEQHIPGNLKEKLKSILTKNIPPLDKKRKKELMLLFNEDQKKLENIFNIRYME